MVFRLASSPSKRNNIISALEKLAVTDRKCVNQLQRQFQFFQSGFRCGIAPNGFTVIMTWSDIGWP